MVRKIDFLKINRSYNDSSQTKKRKILNGVTDVFL